MEAAAWIEVGSFKDGFFWTHQGLPAQYVRVKSLDLLYFPSFLLKNQDNEKAELFVERTLFERLAKKNKNLNDKVFKMTIVLGGNGLPYYDKRAGRSYETWSGARGGLKLGLRLPWAGVYARSIEKKKDPKVISDILFARAEDPKYRLWFKRRTSQIDSREFSALVDKVSPMVHSMLYGGRNGDPLDKSEYVLLSENPLGLFETWIRKKDYLKYLTLYPDVNYPLLEEVERSREEFLPILGMGIFKAYEKATHNYNGRLERLAHLTHEFTSNSTLHPAHQVLLSKSLSEKNPAAQAKPLVDENKLMRGFSARSVGDILGLAEEVPMEWMHMAAFSYGGLEPYICSDEELETDESEEEAEDDHVNLTLANVKEGTELQQPAQAPLNFCLGTSECNTHILRWETAWKKLFQRESGVRQNKMNTTKMVEGSLTICNNSHLKVFEPRKGDSTNFISKPFEEHKELSEIWKTLSFLIFAMEYRVEMKDGSVLLQTEDSEGNFTQTAEFYPFQRQLTTRAECKMDDLVLNTIVNKAKVQKGKKKLHLL